MLDMQSNQPVLMSLVIVMRNVPLEFVHKQRFSFFTSSFVANGVFNLYLVKNGAIVEFDEKCIANGAFGRLMIINTKTFVLDAINFGAEDIDTMVGSRSVGTLGSHRF